MGSSASVAGAGEASAELLVGVAEGNGEDGKDLENPAKKRAKKDQASFCP